MLHPDVVDSVALSFARVRGEAFARAFYQRFLAADPEVRRRFAKTDFEQQRTLFLHGVFALIDFARGRTVGTLAIRRIAQSHGPGQLAIPQRLYDIWLTCLIDTLAYADPEWTPELALAWSATLEPGVRRLKGTL